MGGTLEREKPLQPCILGLVAYSIPAFRELVQKR